MGSEMAAESDPKHHLFDHHVSRVSSSEVGTCNLDAAAYVGDEVALPLLHMDVCLVVSSFATSSLWNRMNKNYTNLEATLTANSGIARGFLNGYNTFVIIRWVARVTSSENI